MTINKLTFFYTKIVLTYVAICSEMTNWQHDKQGKQHNRVTNNINILSVFLKVVDISSLWALWRSMEMEQLNVQIEIICCIFRKF